MKVDERLISESELFQRAKGGDSAARRLLVEQYAPMIYKYFRGLELSADIIDDLMNETFAAFFESLGKFKGESSVKTWIYGIAHNIRCRYFGEKKRSLTALSRSFVERFKTLYCNNAPQDPEEDFLVEEAKHILVVALKTLPLEFREILVFRFMEELSMEETSKILNLPIGTVKSRTYRAKEMLKEKIIRLRNTTIEDKHQREVPKRTPRSIEKNSLKSSGEHLLYCTQIAYRKNSRVPR